MSYSASQRQCLLDLAHDSIRHGLDQGGPLQVSETAVDAELWLQRASFVTLREAGQLRGCIGSVEARRPLARDVCENAFAAAFRDPRFPALRDVEFAGVDISISVLSKCEPLGFDTEADLIDKLRPGTDGLILSDLGKRGTFLPAVWEQLPDPADFLRHLKQKAGLRTDYWSSTIQVQRYTSESF